MGRPRAGRHYWLCAPFPPLPPYLSDRDETTPSHTIVCQRVDELVTTVKEAWALVQAAEWINKKFPRPPIP